MKKNGTLIFAILSCLLMAAAMLTSPNAVAADVGALYLVPASRLSLSVALNNLGGALGAQGRPGEALEVLARALALRPAYGQAHSNRAMSARNGSAVAGSKPAMKSAKSPP